MGEHVSQQYLNLITTINTECCMIPTKGAIKKPFQPVFSQKLILPFGY